MSMKEGRVGVSGASGLVGTALRPWLEGHGYEVAPFLKGGMRNRVPCGIEWEPRRGLADWAALENLRAVVHLAGENIASGRWTRSKKRRIRDSRVDGTAALCKALARLDRPPEVLICASAVGYYPESSAEQDESSPPGDGFLARVCVDWEAAAAPAREAGIRVVNLRIGMVLAREGGALKKMLKPFRLGLGGRIGSGRQFMSWCSLTDLVRIIGFALETKNLEGPVNAVAPAPVTNGEFTRTLGKLLKKPTILPVPRPILRLALGEFAKVVTSSQRILPQRLLAAGFRFEHPVVESALRAALSESAP
ncbi:MAG: TIGR01777 family oxidoreductase [Planctomycetota bacterium]